MSSNCFDNDSDDEDYEGEDYDDEEDDEFSDDDEDGEGSRRKRKRARAPQPKVYVAKNRPNFYGSIPGVEIGRIWETRMACSHDGVQRPPVAGIHGGTIQSNNPIISDKTLPLS